MKLVKIEIDALDHGFTARAYYDDQSVKTASADTASILLRRIAEFCGRSEHIANSRDLSVRGNRGRKRGGQDGQNE